MIFSFIVHNLDSKGEPQMESTYKNNCSFMSKPRIYTPWFSNQDDTIMHSVTWHGLSHISFYLVVMLIQCFTTM